MGWWDEKRGIGAGSERGPEALPKLDSEASGNFAPEVERVSSNKNRPFALYC
jgi:hypothetical protein